MKASRHKKTLPSSLRNESGLIERDGACVAEERCAGGAGEVADVLGGNVADDVAAVIYDSDTAKAIFVHETERIGQRCVGAVLPLAVLLLLLITHELLT